ncbi:MAG: FUSC family protein [Methylobacteriaceae bacterium]|nr:FUSC family protein [Methylobacteriaceae bacterium]
MLRSRALARCVPQLRMVAAAVLSFGIAAAVHLPEAYWAALSAIIVARPLPGAALQAGADRFAGTLLGAGIALGMSFARMWQVPDIVILLATLAPLGVLAAWREGYRTAPIAAVIVLSAEPAGYGAVNAALLRIVEIGLGAAIAVAMSWILLPRRSEDEAEALSRDVLDLQIAALQAASNSDKALARKLQDEARVQTRNLFRLIQTSRWERSDKERLAQLQSFVGRLSGSVTFAVRAFHEAEHTGNPVLSSDALRPLIEPQNGERVAAQRQKSLPERHRVQAHALHYALNMAARDIGELSTALRKA